MVFVSADETLMLDLFLLYIYIYIYTLSYNCVWDYIVCTLLLCYRAETSLVREKKWFGYIKDVTSKSAGCLGISHVVESVLVGRTRGINTTPFKIKLPENRTQPHFSTNCAIQISRFHVPSEKVSHICNNLIEDSLCQLPWPCCALQHNCKGGLGLTKSQEIIASGKQFPSPLLPPPTKKKTKKKMYLILLVLSGVWAPVSTFAFLQFGVFT